jgi:hypothetical protein
MYTKTNVVSVSEPARSAVGKLLQPTLADELLSVSQPPRVSVGKHLQ